MSRTKKILLLGLVLLAVFFVMDFGYFYANVKFELSGNKIGTVVLSAPAATSLPKGSPNWLAIPSLGLNAPIVYVTSTSEDAFQAALKNGVAHFPGTAAPGRAGNCYIFGHSSDFIWSHGHYKTVFAVLPRIKPDAAIEVSDQNGNIYIYIVTNTFVVSPSNASVLSQDTGGQKLLTLQTSWPLGTALERFIVQAKMQ